MSHSRGVHIVECHSKTELFTALCFRITIGEEPEKRNYSKTFVLFCQTPFTFTFEIVLPDSKTS